MVGFLQLFNLVIDDDVEASRKCFENFHHTTLSDKWI